MDEMEYRGKKALVCGMARSGISAAEVLASLGAAVILQDLKESDAFSNTERLSAQGIQLYTGKNPDSIVEEQDLIVLSPGIPSDLPFVKKAKQAGVLVISEIELAYALTPCPVAAVTGTNGKTTTTALLGEMLKKKYPHAAVVGNIGIPYSSEVQRLSAQDYVAVEVSSFQLENIQTFHPKVSAVLNLSPDHLNRHKTYENYIVMKERVFENQEQGDYLILNYEDEICRRMAEKTKATVCYFSSQRPLAEGIYLKEKHIYIKWKNLDVMLVNTADLTILGTHNYENAMAAAMMAYFAEVPISKIREALLEFMGVEHRIEFVCTVDGVDYYNDSKGTNPDAAIRAVLAMKKPIVLLGGGYDKGSDYKEWVETFPNRVKELVLIGKTANKIADEAARQGFTHVHQAGHFDAAVSLCRSLAKKGDCVLLSPACASWDMFQSYEERGRIFKEQVRAFS